MHPKYDLIVALTIDQKSDEREKFISFVNSTPTFDGGFHQDRFRRIFINAIIKVFIKTIYV